jgi:hypothetical protein
MNILDSLWGTIIGEVAFDIVNRTLTISIIEKARGREDAHHSVSLFEVNDWRFYSNFKDPWTYVELTQIEVKPSKDGILLRIMIWSEEAGLLVECKAITFNGTELKT